MWADAEDAGEGPEKAGGSRASGEKGEGAESSEAGGKAKPSGGRSAGVQRPSGRGA